MQNCVGGGAVVENPADQYWCNSIDFSGSFSSYFTWCMIPSENHRFEASPIVPITSEHMQKLRCRVK
jgi:hypothetical protein